MMTVDSIQLFWLLNVLPFWTLLLIEKRMLENTLLLVDGLNEMLVLPPRQ